MTPQKAIDFIENEVQIDVRFCFDEKVNKTIEAFKLAKSALKKQIPETPLPYKGWEGKCPTCGVIFLDRSTNYCGNCGQALNWGDTND